MTFEKNSLSKLWKKMFGGPRFINIHGEDWHNRTKLRLGAPNMRAAFIVASVAGVAITLTSGPLNGALSALIVCGGSLLGQYMSGKFIEMCDNINLSKLENRSIDSTGRAFPSHDTITLLMQIKDLSDETKTGLRMAMTTLVIPTVTLIQSFFSDDVRGRPFSDAISSNFAPIYENTLNAMSLYNLIILSGISNFVMHHTTLIKISKKLLDGDYVFCAPPTPQTQTAEQKLPLGAQSHTPRIAARIS